MTTPALKYHAVISELFAENCYVAHLTDRQECIVVDPGLDPAKILHLIKDANLTPVAILNTHGHSDHIAGNEAIKARWPDCELLIGELEADKLTDADKNLSAPFGMPLVSIPPDRTLADGEEIDVAGIKLTTRLTPGHSTGHVVFVYQEDSPATVFVGDVIFQGSVGRTDFPDGSFDQLAASIRDTLFTLPDDTVLLSGHGPPTTVGIEKQMNPYVGQNANGGY